MIVDANPIVSACLGKSQPSFTSLLASGVDLYVPEHQMREAWLITNREGQRRGDDPRILFAWAHHSLVTVPGEIYLPFESEAKARLGAGGQKDWPLVALSLASDDEVWSNDVDLFGTGIVVWNSFNVRRAKVNALTPPTKTGIIHG